MSLLRHHRERQQRDHAAPATDLDAEIRRRVARMKQRPVGARVLEARDGGDTVVETRGVMFERRSFAAWELLGARVVR